jgi:preprotein translocase subunit SecG
MERVVLVIHLMVTVALIGVILMQKSEGGALGIGGGGMSNFMTGRGTANVLTRTTAILAAVFMVTSILLVVIPQLGGRAPSLIPESGPVQPVPTAPLPAAPAPAGQKPAAPAAPAPAQAPAPAKPATPAAPSVPLGQ